MKKIIKNLSVPVQKHMGEKGWTIQWMPTEMRAIETRLDSYFTLAAGHLMAVHRPDLFFYQYRCERRRFK